MRLVFGLSGRMLPGGPDERPQRALGQKANEKKVT